MVAARLGFQKAMVGTRRATPHPDCMDRLRKHFKRPWLAPGGPPPALTAWTGLENMVGTGRATPRPDCMDRLRKHGWHREGHPPP